MYGRWQSASARRFSHFSLVVHFVGIPLVCRFYLVSMVLVCQYLYTEAMTELLLLESFVCRRSWSIAKIAFRFDFFNRKPQIRPRREFHQREMINRRGECKIGWEERNATTTTETEMIALTKSLARDLIAFVEFLAFVARGHDANVRCQFNVFLFILSFFPCIFSAALFSDTFSRQISTFFFFFFCLVVATVNLIAKVSNRVLQFVSILTAWSDVVYWKLEWRQKNASMRLKSEEEEDD